MILHFTPCLVTSPPPLPYNICCTVHYSIIIEGLDYVNHEDVIPYTNTSMDPFVHELFGQFLVPSDGEKEGAL